MAKYKTVTLAEIKTLKWARTMAEDWKGNTDPKSYDEFDAWVALVNDAIKSVERDRKFLRRLLSPLWVSRDRARREVIDNG